MLKNVKKMLDNVKKCLKKFRNVKGKNLKNDEKC